MPLEKDHTIRISASTDELERIRKTVSKTAGDFGFDESAIHNITLAVDEACTNIIKHAYEWDPSRQIHMKISLRDEEMQISIQDDGKSFDPDQYNMPTAEQQLKMKKRSGYVMLLMRKLMDAVEYRKLNSRNEIRMKKKR